VLAFLHKMIIEQPKPNYLPKFKFNKDDASRFKDRLLWLFLKWS